MEKRVEGQELLKISSELKVANGEAEKKTIRDAIKYSSIVAVVLCVLMTFLEFVFVQRWNFGMVTILMTFAGVTDAFVGRNNNEKNMFIRGVIELVIAVIFLILFVGGLFA
jgi:hypothetical protein